MNEPPVDWPRISCCVFYEDPARAIDWLCEAFGFQVRLKVESEPGRIEHSELDFHGGLVMVGGAGGKYRERNVDDPWKRKISSPGMVSGANTQQLCLHVDDVDGLCERARRAGGEVVYEPTTTDYGEDYWADRSCVVVDPEGHAWCFLQRVRTGKGG